MLSCSIPGSPEANFNIIFRPTWWGATGYLALDHSHKLIVLSFRGSVTVGDWFTNAGANLVDFTNVCESCVHEGFWGAWDTVPSALADKILSAATEHPGYGIVVTGHSRGGAIATIGAMALRSNYTVDVVSIVYGNSSVMAAIELIRKSV